jgi:hypothetical protein
MVVLLLFNHLFEGRHTNAITSDTKGGVVFINEVEQWGKTLTVLKRKLKGDLGSGVGEKLKKRTSE